jgi:ATP-dependent exoDNAse (exonuclease V) beta subunit
MRFYFQYVAELKAPDEVTMDINSPMFGTIFHKSAQNMYSTIKDKNNHITAAAIDAFLKTPTLLKDCIDRAFRTEFFKLTPTEKPVYNGTYLINSRVIEMYMKQLLQFDRRFTPFDVIDEEHWVSQPLSIDTLQGTLSINIGGSIDRLDRIGDTLRIVDYKTGGEPKTIASVEDLFNSDLGRASYICQAFMYSLALQHDMPGHKIKPTLLYIHKASRSDYSSDILIGKPRQPKEPVEDFSVYADGYRNALLKLIDEIFNTDTPFRQAEDADHCQYCDFARICKR